MECDSGNGVCSTISEMPTRLFVSFKIMYVLALPFIETCGVLEIGGAVEEFFECFSS
jgi:hypothetical protein